MSFFDLFPAPNFLKMPVVGFDISDRSIKYIQFENKKNEIFLKQFGEKKLPVGVIEDGEIKKEDEFVYFLKQSFKNDGVNLHNLIVSLPEEKAFIDIIEIPKMDLGEIRNNLNFQLENYFPVKSNEAIFDYKILTPPSQKFFDILVVVFPRRLIEIYQNVLSRAGIFPLAFELEAEALKTSLLKKNGPPKMIVDFGKTRSSFIIAFQDNVLFTSTVKISGEDLDKVLQRSLLLSSPEEAEKIKKEKGQILPFSKLKNFHPVKNSFLRESSKSSSQESISGEVSNGVQRKEGLEEEIRSIFIPTISALRQEIEKNLLYWESHFSHLHTVRNDSLQALSKSRSNDNASFASQNFAQQNLSGQEVSNGVHDKKGLNIKEIILCGGDANLIGLTEYLNSTLKIPVKTANVWLNVFSFEKYIPEIEFNESLKFATAIGLALKGKENFLS